ncbi:DUF2914 domain-containing protein [candidate division KSB1 bacterium]
MINYTKKFTAYIQDPKVKKFLPAGAFFGGFLWDSVTLTRIDRLLDNLILLAYLILLGGLIILMNLIDNGTKLRPLLSKYSKWYSYVIQFLLGGLFSAYVVFYFQSSSFTKASIFFIFLLVFLVVNEFLEKRYHNVYFQISLFFLVNFSFFIFFIPVLFRHFGLTTFLLGGFLSLGIVESILYMIRRFGDFPAKKTFNISRSIPPVLFGILMIFYVFNWIPPVPLSLKFYGIYRNVEKVTENGILHYNLSFEKPPWYKPWKNSENPYKYSDNNRVICFTAVFASSDLKTSIFHHWQRYSESQDMWLTTDKIECDITGGRDDGYRLYTVKENIEPGEWRIEVKTTNELLLGSIDLDIVEADEETFEIKTITRQ